LSPSVGTVFDARIFGTVGVGIGIDLGDILVSVGGCGLVVFLDIDRHDDIFFWLVKICGKLKIIRI